MSHYDFVGERAWWPGRVSQVTMVEGEREGVKSWSCLPAQLPLKLLLMATFSQSNPIGKDFPKRHRGRCEIYRVMSDGRSCITNSNRFQAAPTFFDPDATSIVNVADTQRGFSHLGLTMSATKMAAYTVHSTFTYSTAGAWVLQTPMMPIQIDNMSKTHWGCKWGDYEHLN
ncbi:hypothetical protein K438DRAFT_1766503 [Mycena galopus ATCC 62051]|nr:hypothetical protein K438DRAFT_1766503 [Mycena galopus ATCC 62051]